MSFSLFVFDSTLKQLCYYDSSLSSVLSPTGELAGGSLLLSCRVLHSWCCLQPGPLPLLLKLPFHCYPSDIIMTTITWINIWLSQKTISFFFLLCSYQFLLSVAFQMGQFPWFHTPWKKISISIKKVFSFDIYHLNHTKKTTKPIKYAFYK